MGLYRERHIVREGLVFGLFTDKYDPMLTKINGIDSYKESKYAKSASKNFEGLCYQLSVFPTRIKKYSFDIEQAF